VREVVLIVP